VDLAKSRLDHNFIGIERLLGRIRKMDRKARRAGLINLRGMANRIFLLSGVLTSTALD